MGPVGPRGLGIGLAALSGAKVSLVGSSVVGNATVGLCSTGAAMKTDVNASGTLIRGTLIA